MGEMVEQGYNYLDGPIHSMAEFFETRIENLEKSIHLKCYLKKQQKIQEKRILEKESSGFRQFF